MRVHVCVAVCVRYVVCVSACVRYVACTHVCVYPHVHLLVDLAITATIRYSGVASTVVAFLEYTGTFVN